MASLEDTLTALASHQKLKPSQMKQLSGLASEQLRQVRGVWSTLPDPERMHILASLRRHADGDSLTDFDSIYGMAMDDPNADVRRVAVSAVLADDNPVLLPRLLDLCASDPVETVRAAAAERLGGFAYEAELGTLPENTARQIQQVLLERVKSETEGLNVRARALASVGYFSTDEVRDEIRRGLAREELRVASIRAIGRNLDPVWTEVLIEQMGSDDPTIRQEAAEASAEYEDTVEALADLVDDPEMPVRLAAIAALGKIGGAEAKDVLVYCYESDDPAIKKAASQAMRQVEVVEDPLGSAGPEWDEDEEIDETR